MKLKLYTLTTILFFVFSKNTLAEIDCYNGIDDDGDGLIDLDDPDCFCQEIFIAAPTNLILNPSFTNTASNCAPNYTGCYDLFSVQNECVEDWVSVNNSLILTQYYTTCYTQGNSIYPNTDDFLPNDDAFVEVITTVNSSFPTSGSDYLGGTLVEPLEAGEFYEFKVYLNPLLFTADIIQIDPTTIEHVVNYGLYGHVSNNNFPYPDSYRSCPTEFAPNDYVELGRIELTTMGENTWVEATIEFEAPQEIGRFAFGGTCDQNNVSGLDFYTFSTLMDSFSLKKLLPVDTSISLVVDILDVSDACENQITLQTTGIGGASYQWYFNNEEIIGGTSAALSFENEMTNSGNYFVQVIDSIGSCGISDFLEITIDAPLEVSADLTNVTCFDEDNGAINLEINAPSGLSYLWLDAQGNFISDSQNIENLMAGNYTLEITTSDDCTLNYTYEISQSEEIQVSVEMQNAACADGTLAQILVNAIGGFPNYLYSIDGVNFSADSTFALAPGNYEIIVEDQNLCQQSLQNVIVEAPTVSLLEIIPSSEIIQLGETVQLELLANNPLDSAMIEWSPSEFLDCANCPEVNGNILETTNFQVAVTENGCTTNAGILIQVEKNRDVFIPNAFSPNGDGYNDEFKIYTGIGVEAILDFKIFNRWGALIFDDPAKDWDGSFQNKLLQNGVYVWMVEIRFKDGFVKSYQGDVTLTK